MDFFDLCSHPRAETYPYPFPKGEAAAQHYMHQLITKCTTYFCCWHQRRSKDATKEWVCYKECMSLGRERATRGHFEAIFLGVFLGMALK